MCIALLFGEQCRPSFPFPYLLHESWWLKRVFSLLTVKNTAIQLHHFTFVQFALVKIRKQSWTAIWCSKTNICTNNSECIFLSFCYFDTFDAWIQECLHWNASCLWQFGKRNMSVVSQQFLCSLTCFVFFKYWRMFTSLDYYCNRILWHIPSTLLLYEYCIAGLLALAVVNCKGYSCAGPRPCLSY